MRNRPFHELNRPLPSGAPLIDQAPRLRLAVLYVAWLIPVAAISGRLCYVQLTIADRFTSVWSRTEELERSIPARDGRILTADGLILAYDQPRFDVAIHYRWLEEPADRDWVDSEARARLPPAARRDPARLEEARQTLVAQREALRAELAAVTGVSVESLRERSARIQARVERMYAKVLERRANREQAPVSSPGGSDTAWWERAWSMVVDALTTPPERPHRDPLVIQEQLAYHVLAEDVPLSAVAAIESSPSRFPGVEIRQAGRRVYPAGPLAAHLVGVRTPISAEELAERAARFPDGDPLGYEPGDRLGRTGIERAYDSLLRGRRGLRRIVRDRRGVVLQSQVIRPPLNGRDVVLTFDSRLQSRAEALLDAAIQLPSSASGSEAAVAEPLDAPPARTPAKGGCLVALDVRTGHVLAAAAAPRFDARLLVDYDAQAWQDAVADPRQPFFPRITQMTLPPGSVFKTLTAVAVLESGIVDPDALFHCRGYLDHPDRNRCLIYRHYGAGHGDVDLDEALCQSCNVYFFEAARRIGPRAIHDWATRFGLGATTGVDVPGERAGHLPSPDADRAWYPGTTLQFAIGQASLTVTPLQVVRMMAAVANDGYLVTPTFVQPQPVDVGDTAGDVVAAGFETDPHVMPRERISGLSPGTLERVRSGLRLAVESPRGTGKRVRLKQIAIAGKTGTAEVGGGQPDHAWFAGYAPADDPRVAFVVVLEHGGSGGHTAGPLAREFVEALLETGVLSPTQPDRPD